MSETKETRELTQAFEFCCTRRLSDLITREEVMTVLDAVTAHLAVEVSERELGVPLYERALAALAESKTPVSEWLPESARDRIRSILVRPITLDRRAVERALNTPEIRDEIRRVIEEALASFIESGFAAAPGGKSVKGMLGLGMKTAGAVLGSIGTIGGALVEDRVRVYADKALVRVLKSIADRLSSRATAVQLGQGRARIFEGILSRTEAELVATAREMFPVEPLRGTAAEISEYHRTRAVSRERVERAIDHAIAELSKRTVGQWLDLAGLREPIGRVAIAQGARFLLALRAATPTL